MAKYNRVLEELSGNTGEAEQVQEAYKLMHTKGISETYRDIIKITDGLSDSEKDAMLMHVIDGCLAGASKFLNHAKLVAEYMRAGKSSAAKHAADNATKDLKKIGFAR